MLKFVEEFYNKNHGAGGRFASAPGSGVISVKAADQTGLIHNAQGNLIPSHYSQDLRNNREVSAQVARINARVEEHLAAGRSTEDLYSTVDENGVRTYTPERQAVHAAILDKIMADHVSVPNDGQLVIMGGPAGAGKSTAAKKLAELTGADIQEGRTHVTVNPDEMKTLLQPHQPAYQGLKPNEAAGLVHEESSHLAKMLQARLIAERKNALLDVTMIDRASTEKKMAAFKAAGYHSTAVFVGVPTEVSLQRAGARYIAQSKTPAGGRWVPPKEIIKANLSHEVDARGKPTPRSRKFRTTNEETFRTLRRSGIFDRHIEFDNSGSGPVELARGGKW